MHVATVEDIIKLIRECARSGKAADVPVARAPMLRLRVAAGGRSASWGVLYRMKGDRRQRRIRLGTAAYGLDRQVRGGLTIDDARKAARVLAADIARGIDPLERAAAAAEERRKVAEEKRRLAQRITVAEAVHSYVAAKSDLRSIKNIGGILRCHLVARHGDRALDDLTRAHVMRMRDEIVAAGHRRHADHVVSMTRALLNWAKRRQYVTENAAAGLDRVQSRKATRRERVLTAAEVRALWLLLDSADINTAASAKRIIRVALLTGQRANEIAGMRRSELSADLMLWSVPGSRMKAGQPHVLPLPPMVRHIIAEALAETSGSEAPAKTRGSEALAKTRTSLVFPGRGGKVIATAGLSHAMQHLNAKLAFVDADGNPSPARLHDLRRTLVTGLQHLGTPEAIYKRIIAHTASDGATAHYAHAELTREAGLALLRWQRAVTDMVRGGDPLATHGDTMRDAERAVLGADLLVTAEKPQSANVVGLRLVGGA